MKRNTARVAGALTPILAPLPTEAQVYGDGMGMWHGTWGWGHMAIGSMMMVLFWAALAKSGPGSA